MVVAGPTPDSVHVMIPDCLVAPVGGDVRIDLHHVDTLQLGPATDMGNNLPPPDLARALCRKPRAPTLGLQRRDYWEEVNPLIDEWRSVNDSKCPKCDRVIRVNMARHLRLVHTTYVCFWRCPVSTCPLWFTSELNGKDHIERTHRFREGRGHSFYECLREYGLEWFGSRTFFDQRKLATQSLWMDLALARHSGQELHNTYTITKSPEFAPFRRFFTAAVKQLQLIFDDLPVPSGQPSMPSANPLLETMRTAVDNYDASSEDSVVLGSTLEEPRTATIPVSSSPSISSADDVNPTISAAHRLTPANRSLRFLEAGALGASQPHHMPSRPAVPDLCIASSRLLSCIDPLPLDRLACQGAWMGVNRIANWGPYLLLNNELEPYFLTISE